jgi:hypothetical protein
MISSKDMNPPKASCDEWGAVLLSVRDAKAQNAAAEPAGPG